MGILQRSEPRDGYRVRVLAVHTTEGTSYTAAQLRDAGWWVGSSHAIADDRTLLTPAEGCVPYDRAAWTLRSGNRWSENIEQVAYARWSRAEWLAHPGLLENTARWLADRSKARGIPLVKISAAQYRAGASGVIGHIDHTTGYQDGTHWDPGPGYPYDVVIARAKQIANPPEDEVTDADIEKIVAALRKADFSPADGTQSLQNLVSQTNTALNGPVGTEYTGYDKPVSRAKMIEYVDRRTGRIEAKVDELLELLRGQQPPAA